MDPKDAARRRWDRDSEAAGDGGGGARLGLVGAMRRSRLALGLWLALLLGAACAERVSAMSLADHFDWFDDRSSLVRNDTIGDVTYFDSPDGWSLELPSESDRTVDRVDCGSVSAQPRVVELTGVLSQTRVLLSDESAAFTLVGFFDPTVDDDPRIPAYRDWMDEVLEAVGSSCRSADLLRRLSDGVVSSTRSALVDGPITVVPGFGDEPLQVAVGDDGLVLVSFGDWLRAATAGEVGLHELTVDDHPGGGFTLVEDAERGRVLVTTSLGLHCVETGVDGLMLRTAEDGGDVALVLEVGEDPTNDRARPSWLPDEFGDEQILGGFRSASGAFVGVVLGSGDVVVTSAP